MRDNKIKDLVESSLIIALICVGIMVLQIPTNGGYIHLGDSIIFVSVVILGKRRGALAAGLGGFLADFLSPYAIWAVPTFIIKYIMAYIMGAIVEKQHAKNKYSWILGATIGSVWQVFGYALAGTIMFNLNTALADIPSNVIQSISGAVIAIVIIFAASKTSLSKKLFKNA